MTDFLRSWLRDVGRQAALGVLAGLSAGAGALCALAALAVWLARAIGTIPTLLVIACSLMLAAAVLLLARAAIIRRRRREDRAAAAGIVLRQIARTLGAMTARRRAGLIAVLAILTALMPDGTDREPSEKL